MSMAQKVSWAPGFLVALLAGCGPGFVPIDGGPGDTAVDDGSGTDMSTDLPDAQDGDAEDVDVEPFCGDGVVGNGETCDPGASVGCTTTCGSTGVEECASDCSAVLSCIVPDETCNNADDDCDTIVDDALTDCRCTTDDPLDHEECNDIDDDCDGEVDEGLADCRCTTDDPLDHEECNDIDDDCDGEVDEGLVDCRCTTDDPLDHEECNHIDDDCDGVIDDGLTDCGCTGGVAPASEVCDRIDNDCDGEVDEENTHVSPAGTCLGFGEACVPVREECSSGLCVGDQFDMYCTEECNPAAPDPPCTSPEYRCYDDPGMGETDHCRRNYDACTKESDCGLGETCTVVPTDDGLALGTECRPALNMRDLDQDCGAGMQCGNDICVQSTFCSEICHESSDCGATTIWACVWTWRTVDGATGYIPECQHRCGDDTDCTRNVTIGACQPGATSPAPYQGTGYCSSLGSGQPTGGDCDHTAVPPVVCDHRICNDGGTGVCTEPCDDSGDCTISGWTCLDSSVTFDGFIGTVPMRVCDSL